jgi:hypothetical protein
MVTPADTGTDEQIHPDDHTASAVGHDLDFVVPWQLHPLDWEDGHEEPGEPDLKLERLSR